MDGSTITETYPLSPMQQGMVFHSVYDQTAGFYTQQMICSLREDLNVGALQKAWDRVVERHGILRTAFRWELESPVQEVESVSFGFAEEDWRDKSEAEQTERLGEYLRSDRRRGFELDKPPLMRLALFRLSEIQYRMIWTFHHALLDGRSHHLVLKEVFTLYEAYRSGENPELNEPRPYRDYIEWLGRRDSSNDERFWRRRLEGLAATSSLDFNGPPIDSHKLDPGGCESYLDEKTTAALKSLADRHELTLNTLVQGTWALLLEYYGRSGDVVFGATRACRRSTIDGADDMVGMFINTLPVRVRLSRGMPLIQWLKDLRQQDIEVRDYEHTPLLKIQSWSELAKGAPLFESILVFENYEFNDSLRVLSGNWRNRHFRLEEKNNYPVVIAAYAGASLRIKIQYDQSRFADAAIGRVLRQFRTVLTAFLSAPAENLSCDDLMRYLINDPHEKLDTVTVQEDDAETDVYIFPASFGQQRLWFLNQLEPASSFYNIPLVARIKGDLKADVLSRSVNAIVERHEALRTTFTAEDGKLLQLIAPQAELILPETDLTEVPNDEREAIAERLAKSEAEVPFDLERGPLLRAGLLKLMQDEHLLLLTMHHICSDGWSMGVFLDELTALYQAFLAEEPSPLPDPPIQYADFSEWQRELLEGSFLEEQLVYWRKQLAGAPAVLELPADRPRSPVQTFRGDRRTLDLSEKLRDQLSDLSRREGVTMFMTLLATFQTLLHRYTGRDDIVVGSPSANRNRSEIEKLIGFFVNTLVLRTDFSGNPTFLELLKRVREVAVGAYMHQDVPFDRLVDDLNPERSLSHSPLFQVIFALEKSWEPDRKLAGMDISWLEVDRGTSKFDLALFVSENSSGFSCLVEYDTDLFNAETIGRMLDHFQVLLEGVAKNPEQRVGELPLLTAPELERMIGGPVKSNAAPPAVCLHHLFERQVERTPESVALTFESQQLTYRELNARANQLAHYLRRQGVGPDVLVGLWLERSVDMIVSVLGILKAGGAYLPIDPAYPEDRLLFMLEDAEARVLVTSAELVERVRSNRSAVLVIDREWEKIAHESRENPETNCVAENLAYVIYTSGSTGKPKGVFITHSNVARLFEVTDPLFRFNEDDVWTLFHSSAFDFSVWEIWGALLFGGRLVVVPYWVSRAPEEFLELLVRERVTMLNQTPSAFRQLVRAATATGGKEALSLRFIIFGGEALELQGLKPWFDRYGDGSPRLVNMYGITETTVHVTYRPLSIADIDDDSGSVVGYPLDDLQVYLLDQRQQLVPAGVPGEMYVGGAGLSRGYLKRPDLTAERFVPDSFSNVPGARLYRSGDLGRHLANGDVEYLGRVDRQVKIRGFRIELGEIESVLRQSHGVHDCAVVTKADLPGDTTLVAYVVLDSERAGKIDELRSYAKEKLPDYMVPSFFVPLERIPLTPNGKVDTRALPLPEKSRSDSSDALVEPRTDTEKKLAALWGELLGRDQIGVYDNFFELGGHSLLATQVVSRVRDAFQVRLSLRSFFENPTVAALAQFVAGSTKESAEAATPIKRLQRDDSPTTDPLAN